MNPTPSPTPVVPQGTPWFVRMLEGGKRDTHGIFTDQSTRPLIKSKDAAALQKVADAHNESLEAHADLKRLLERAHTIIATIPTREPIPGYLAELHNMAQPILTEIADALNPES